MENNKLWNLALVLAVITVFYNILEGLASVYFGAADESLTLFGFGLDSFIEVLSGIGIWRMIVRLNRNNEEKNDKFEKTALRITGISFYILTAGLMLTVIYNLYLGHKPSTTFWGIIISIVSIVSMVFLMNLKKYAGKRLNSDAILADADCTKNMHLFIRYTSFIKCVILFFQNRLY